VSVAAFEDLGIPTVSLGRASEDYGSWLLYGPQGSGKTVLASTIAQVGPTAFIDLMGEHGVKSFLGAPWAPNITVFRPTSVTQIDNLYWALRRGNHPFKAVIIDSFTSAQRLSMRFLQGDTETAIREINRGRAPATFGVWGQALEVMGDLATYFCDLAAASHEQPLHVVLISQAKTVENELEGIIERIPDVQKGAVSSILTSPDYVLWTQVEKNPDADGGDDSVPPMLHTALFGEHPGYRTKARIPYDLHGKLPHVLGRGGSSVDLYKLSKVLRIKGVPAKPFIQQTTKALAAPAAGQ
jgi:hypothetical protein